MNDLMHRRRQIMGSNVPSTAHLATATGNPLTFATDMIRPLQSLVIPFTPVQEGSGYASIDNVRLITGWNGCEINHSGADISNPDTLNVSWEAEAGTVHGGRLTINADGTGTLSKMYAYRDMSKFASISGPSGSGKWAHRFNLRHWTNTYDKQNGETNMICDVCRTVSDAMANYCICGLPSTSDMYVYDDTISTVAEFKAKYAGHYIAYVLKSNQWNTYNLTKEQVGKLITFSGTNTIWTDTNGSNTATYLTH